MKRERALTTAALLGALGVAAGAFGAHALAGVLDDGARAVYETGVRYHLVHTLALLAAGCGPDVLWREPWCGRACIAFVAGIVLFSGSLYLLALGAPRWLGPVTPLGGLSLIGGWLGLAAAAWRADWTRREDAGT